MITRIAVALALCSSFQPTVPHPLEGAWKITYPWHLEMENGVAKPVMETGELKVEAHGDSLIATLVTTHTSEFSPTRPFRLATLRGSDEAVFVMRDQVSFNMRGTERQAIAVSTWILQADGDQIRGSLERRLEGINEGLGRLPLTGNRIRP